MLSPVHIHGTGSLHVHPLFLPPGAVCTASASHMCTSAVCEDSQTYARSSTRRPSQSVQCWPQFSTSVPGQELKTEMKFSFPPLPTFSKPVYSVVFSVRTLKKTVTPDLIRSRLAFLFLRIVNKITLLKKKNRMECKCCTNLITLWRWETLM